MSECERLAAKKVRLLAALASTKKELETPCKHRITGAHLNPFLCEKCAVDFYFYLSDSSPASLQKYKFHFDKHLPAIELEKERSLRRIENERKRQMDEARRTVEIAAENQRKQEAIAKQKEKEQAVIVKYGEKLAKYISPDRLDAAELGKRYERYVGYLLEIEGWRVEFNGILKGKQDGGIDIIAKKKGVTLIVQCKRYGRDNSVHVNTVHQLVGASEAYKRSHPKAKVISRLYTQNNNLDNVADNDLRLFPNIEHIVNPYPFDIGSEYPLIKCNIGGNNEKIYHLPHNQSYDTIKIEIHKGEFYAYTPAEAVAKGFRPARN